MQNSVFGRDSVQTPWPPYVWNWWPRQHLIRYRNSNVVGQQMSMRARTITDTVSDCIDAAAARYRCGRDAMARLRGEESCSQYRVLTKEDITAVQLQERDVKATKQLGKVGSWQSRGGPVVREKPPKLSWIWDIAGRPRRRGRRLCSWVYVHVSCGLYSALTIFAAVRVEWAKALARKTRWCEEVNILHEEMK